MDQDFSAIISFTPRHRRRPPISYPTGDRGLKTLIASHSLAASCSRSPYSPCSGGQRSRPRRCCHRRETSISVLLHRRFVPPPIHRSPATMRHLSVAHHSSTRSACHYSIRQRLPALLTSS